MAFNNSQISVCIIFATIFEGDITMSQRISILSCGCKSGIYALDI